MSKGIGLGAILDPKMLKDSLYVAGGGALGAVGYDLLSSLADKDKKLYFDTPFKQTALAAGLLVVGGGLLWKRQPDMAKGLVGALGGQLGRGLYAMARKAMSGALSDDLVLEALPEEQELTGLSTSQQVLEERRVGGTQVLGASVDVEEAASLGTWMAGAGSY